MNIGSSLLDIGYSIALSKFRISPHADALGLLPSKSLSVSLFGIAIGIGVVIAIGIAIVPVAFFFFRSRFR